MFAVVRVVFSRSLGFAVKQQRTFAVSSSLSSERRSYRLVVVGGGTAGCAIGSKFGSHFGNGKVAIVEPSDIHYYQPMLTLIGGGLRSLPEAHRPMKDVLPPSCDWIQDSATAFDPDNCQLTTKTGFVVKYDFLVVAMGLQLNYHQIKGCLDALEDRDSNVCSVYSSKYVTNVLPTIQRLSAGNALFTFPVTPVKCAGAAQKICFLAEEHVTQKGRRDSVQFTYNTGPPVIFSNQHYAAALENLAASRNIEWNKCRNLVEVRSRSREAVFDVMKDGKSTGQTQVFKYSMLHVTPPMSTPSVLWRSALVDDSNFVSVDKHTLQHVKYKNVFALGDCTTAPTSKTAAACTLQVAVVSKNVKLVADGKEPSAKYNGYTSCPLIVNHNKVMLAEFGYDGSVLETFPVDQRVPRRLMYYLTAYVMPLIYWKLLLRGMWHGPGFIRKLLRFGF